MAELGVEEESVGKMNSEQRICPGKAHYEEQIQTQINRKGPKQR